MAEETTTLSDEEITTRVDGVHPLMDSGDDADTGDDSGDAGDTSDTSDSGDVSDTGDDSGTAA